MMKNLSDIKFSPDLFPTVDAEDFLSSKGLEFQKLKNKRGNWARMLCPFPEHDDSNPSFFIHLDHGGYNCYVCGSGNWSTFCQRMGWEIEQLDTVQVDLIPNAIWKDTLKGLTRIQNQDDDKIKEDVFKIPQGYKRITVDDKMCRRHFEYLKNRGLLDLVDLYKLGYTIQPDNNYKKNYNDRIIIPVHDSIGKFIWPEGRLIHSNIKKRKYYRPDGVMKTEYLFNIHRVLREKFDWVIVVEGIIDAMLLWFWKFPAVCCFGAEISDEQFQLLNTFNKIYFCLDNDPAGIKGWVHVKEKLGTGADVYRTLLPKNKDVNVLNDKKIFEKYFMRSEHIIIPS